MSTSRLLAASSSATRCRSAVALAGDDPRGVDQRLVIAAKSRELLQNLLQDRPQRRQFAAERLVALFALAQLFPKQRVIHDANHHYRLAAKVNGPRSVADENPQKKG